MSYKKNEWKNGDEITATKLNHMENAIAEASNDSGTAGLTSVFGADIDIIEKINRSLVLYIRDVYEHAPFDYGLIITHSYPDMAFFSGPKFEQLAISLDVGTKGKCYARTVAPLEDEAEGTYAPTSDDWHEVSYTKDEIDALLVREIDLTKCSTVTTGTPTITSNSIMADDAIISVAASGKVEIEANVQHGASGSLTINGARHSVTYGAPFTFSGTVEGPILVGVGFGKLTFDKFTTTGDYMLEKRVADVEDHVGNIDAALDTSRQELMKKIEKTGEVAGKNLFNKDTVSDTGEWIGTKGQFESNEYTTKYFHSDYIPVEGGESYTYSGGDAYGTRMYSYVWYDSSKTLISRVGDTYYNSEPLTIVAPDNACYIAINFYDGISTVDNVQFEKGTEATEYEPFEGSGGFYCDGLIIKASQIEGFIPDEEETEATVKLIHLPEKYELVVGDTFELFYKGIMLCKNPYNYNIFVSCNIGKAWERKYEVTPTTAGTYPLTITVSDDKGNVIDTASTNLVVEAKMTSPASVTNVLCIGDSLTTGGEWVDEVYRRLAKTTDTTSKGHAAPTGEGLTNINFIGKKTTSNGAGYEGFGGWRFEEYLSTTTTTSNYWLTCTHTKTDNDQESIYEDESGVQWQLETIEASRLKFKKYNGSGTMPKSGTLTHVSGGVDTSDVVFTKSTLEDGNPFVYNGAIDFASYCSDIGASGIDVCYILLGWNDVSTEKEVYKSQTKSFIDLLLSFNSNMKIVLMGLEIPSLDGCANNYGAKGNFANWRRVQEYVFALDDLYGEVANDYPNNVTAINISGQFDTENNMLTTSVDVNARNTAKITVQSNGLHPAVFGYYQIADAVYRKFNNDNN